MLEPVKAQRPAGLGSFLGLRPILCGCGAEPQPRRLAPARLLFYIFFYLQEERSSSCTSTFILKIFSESSFYSRKLAKSQRTKSPPVAAAPTCADTAATLYFYLFARGEAPCNPIFAQRFCLNLSFYACGGALNQNIVFSRQAPPAPPPSRSKIIFSSALCNVANLRAQRLDLRKNF